MNRFELRADDVPVEVVQLDVADTDVGNVAVECVGDFLVHSSIPFHICLAGLMPAVYLFSWVIISVFCLFVNSNY